MDEDTTTALIRVEFRLRPDEKALRERLEDSYYKDGIFTPGEESHDAVISLSLIHISMISSNKIRTNASHRIKVKSTQILKYGVVYGANASGKTNLVEFFRFFKECVQTGICLLYTS